MGVKITNFIYRIKYFVAPNVKLPIERRSECICAVMNETAKVDIRLRDLETAARVTENCVV
jgi:hypothetical protein